MDEHKAQIRPGSEAMRVQQPQPPPPSWGRSALPPHVEAMLSQAARLSSNSASGNGHAVNGLSSSSLLEAGDSSAMDVGSPLFPFPSAPAAGLPLVPLGVSSPDRAHHDAEEGSDAGSDLNEVEDAPKHAIIAIESDDEEMRAATTAHLASPAATPTATAVHNSSAAPQQQQQQPQAAQDASDEEEEEVDDTAYCYCQQKWSGDEMMVSCDQCLQWFHADCMGIPPSSDMAHEEFKCDACRLSEGLPANNFPLPRRNRRAEIEAALSEAAAGRQRKTGRARSMSQRQRDALETLASAPVRTKADVEASQQRSKARAAKRAQKQADKAAGMNKQQRAAKRAQERAARKQQRTAVRARQEKADKAGGLKNLLATFDQSSSEESSSDSSDSDSSQTSSVQTLTPRSAAGAATSTPPSSSVKAASPSLAVSGSSPSRAPRPLAKVTPVARKAATGSAAGVKSALSAMWEPVRAKVRESLTPLLGADLGAAVEESLFQVQRGVGAVYKSQWRDIIANLKDPANDLKKRVVSGAVSPASLSRMTAKELASSELANLREEIRKDAVKMSVRPVTPPRPVMLCGNEKADHSLPSEAVADIVNSMIQEKPSLPSVTATTPSTLPPPGTPRGAKDRAMATGATGPQTSLDSLPVLPSFDDVLRSFQSQKKDAQSPNASADAKKTTDSHAAARLKKKALGEKNAAIAAAANAALAASKAKARARQTAGVTTISDSSSSDSNDSDGEAKAPSAERIPSPPKKSTAGAGADPEELLYQNLNLPPMDVWNGDLLLSAGANPSLLTNYFPLTAKQVGGPPVLTLPLPSRIEEKLRIDLAAVESYLMQVIRSGSSKRIVVVELHLNVPAGNSSAAASTMQQDYEDFCRNYRNKNRALAFDYQKESDPSSRMLLYVVPPDANGSGLTPEFVRKHLKLQRPQGRMWGVVLLPKETYQLIAKRISRVSLEKMQAQAAALQRVNKAHQETAAAEAAAAAAATAAAATAAATTSAAATTAALPTAATAEPKPTPVRTGPVDPRARPSPAAAPVAPPAAAAAPSTSAAVPSPVVTAPAQPVSTGAGTAAAISSGSVASSSSVASASSSSSGAVSSSSDGASSSSLVGSGGLASLLAGGPGSFDALSSYLSSLVGKVQPTATTAAAPTTASVPSTVSTSAAAFPPPPPPPPPAQLQQVSPAPLPAPTHFPPPPPAQTMPPSFLPPPPPMPQPQQHHTQQQHLQQQHHPGLYHSPPLQQQQQQQLPPPPHQPQSQPQPQQGPYGPPHSGLPFLPHPPQQPQQHTPSPQAPHHFMTPPPAGQFPYQPQQQHPQQPQSHQLYQAPPPQQQFQQLAPPPPHHLHTPPPHFTPPPPPHQPQQQQLPPPPPQHDVRARMEWERMQQQQQQQPQQHYGGPPPSQHPPHPHAPPQQFPPPPMHSTQLPPPSHMQQQPAPPLPQSYPYGAPPPQHAHDSHKRPREEGPHGAEGAPPPRRSRFGPALDESQRAVAVGVATPPPPTHYAPTPAPPSHRGGGSVKDGPPFLGQGVCRFFFSPRGCVKDRCAFSHDPSHAAAAQQANAQQAATKPHFQPRY